MKRQCARVVLAASLVLASSMAQSALVEEVVDMPIHVKNLYGHGDPQTMKVVIWRDDAITTPQPFALINHGRDGKNFTTMPLARYPAQAQYLVARGYAVFVPTRVGYGPTGGVDIEDIGSCKNSPQYTAVYKTMAEEIAKVVEIAKTKPYVDGEKGVVIGGSYGGMLSIAVAAKNIPGVLGVINFAGGAGGNPGKEPCRADRIEDEFASFGKTATIPTLWLYSENDQYFAPKLAKDWFAAFTKNGGKGEFVTLPAFGEDGHLSFVGNSKAWRPHVEPFLASLQLPSKFRAGFKAAPQQVAANQQSKAE